MNIILVAQNLILYNARGTFKNWLNNAVCMETLLHDFKLGPEYFQVCKQSVMTQYGMLFHTFKFKVLHNLPEHEPVYLIYC